MIATPRPANIASPPHRGVGKMWTSRSLTSAMAPKRIANARAVGVSKYVTAAAAAKHNKYSRIDKG